MNTKHNTYLDLSKLSEVKIKEVENIIGNSTFAPIEFWPILFWNNEIMQWDLTRDKNHIKSKTEISFPEWKSMTEGASAENTQVEYPDNSYQSVIATLEAENKELRIENEKLLKTIEDRTMLIDRVSAGLDRELKRQKKAGKKFLSDEEIDDLIDNIIKEELLNKERP